MLTKAQYFLGALADARRNVRHSRDVLRVALLRYQEECPEDHDHGRGPIPPDAPCPGSDCYVYKARKDLEVLNALLD